MNRIEVSVATTIVALHKQGWSQRRIARELGLDRETVRRYVRQAEPKPAIVPPGTADPLPTAKPAIVPAGILGRSSLCWPHRDWIELRLESGLSAQRIWQDLKTEKSFEGAYDSVKRFCRRLTAADPRRFERMECLPGEEAQVDFGTGAPILTAEGRIRRTHVFRMVLSCSRKGYSEAVREQSTETFLRCLENAFRYFGGVPQRLIIDNLKAAVTRADWYDPVLNPKIEAFCRHYGTVILPTRPYTPRHKGKIERGIGYVKNNALKGRRFESLAEENRYLADWEKNVADLRIHGTTRKQVQKLFEEQERSALQPLPPTVFPSFQEARRTVHRDGFVEVRKAYYEVPEEYITRQVWVRWDSRLLRVFNSRWEQIAVHARVDPGRFSRDEKLGNHTRVQRSEAYLLGQVRLMGDHSYQWAAGMLRARGPAGLRVLHGLLAMTGKHSSRQMEEICRRALTHEAWRLEDLRRLLEQPTEQNRFEFMDVHPLIRDLDEYGALIQTQPATPEAALA